MKVAIIGAGINGLMTAWHCMKSGHQVTILEKNDGSDNCSFGNAGYICPSHIIQLASPGVITQGLKWMLKSDSPFYVQPRLSMDLIKWLWNFRKSATTSTVNKNAKSLFYLLNLSREIYLQINEELNDGFKLKKEGCLMVYNTDKSRNKELKLAEMAQKFGMITEEIDNAKLNEMEPEMNINALGAVYYPIDCHVNPPAMMKTLTGALISKGVRILYNQSELKPLKKNSKVTAIQTSQATHEFDKLVITAGSWTPYVVRHITGYSLLIQPGKGYSITYKNTERKLRHSAILSDFKVALTPIDEGFRVGGTMELSGINQHIKINRVEAILKAASTVYRGMSLPPPTIKEIWHGLRPCSPDGLPYIDRVPGYDNILVAAGHAMIGVASAALTGKLVQELIDDRQLSIQIDAFRINRFG